ncbi:MAG: hypothetical protein HC910_22550 [Spirulinaceae cyanobacterium SM2_1_0]|nr:hypothetical protein [Spirulinaceae cyanobacterium SM2_1_0]
MSIEKSALSTKFRPLSTRERDDQSAFRKQQAVFYTLRSLIWEESKGRIFKDAVDDGTLDPIAPPVRKADGFYSRPEYDSADVKQLYAEAWEQFKEEFDRGFIKATLEELVEFARKHYQHDLESLLALNAERNAARFNRAI